MVDTLSSQMKGIDRPLHAQCRAFVASHETVGGDLGPGRYDLSQDVIACETSASFGGSTANMTLLPRRPYIQWLFPGDWISIYFSSGADAREGFGVVGMRESREDDTRVFFGMISAVREQVTVAQNGQAQVRISLSCNGVQGMFEKTQVYYNQQLGPQSLFGSLLPGLGRLTLGIPLTGTPASLPRSIALAYLGFGGQLLLPQSYPGGFGNDDQRSQAVKTALQTSLAIEDSLGILQTRGATGKVNPTLIQRTLKSAQEEYPSRSLAGIVDFFTYVEDMYVSGRLVATPVHELQGSVWGLMTENSNPIMNEMFMSLLPPRKDDGTRDYNQSDEDEWGMRPFLRPSLVLRERPFAWRDEMYNVPSGKGARLGQDTANINFGSVFFSQRGVSNKFKQEQFVTNNLSKLTPAGKIQSNHLQRSVRAVDRIKVRASDVRTHTLGLSDNDQFNFFMINMSQTPLSQVHQKFTLLLDGLVPIFLPESIKRYGLRLRDMSTKFMYTGGGDVDSRLALDYLVRCLMAYDVWYQHAPWYRAGTISLRPIPAAQPGMVLDVEWPNAEESYYVEQVNQSFTHGQNGSGLLSTNLTVTRGQPSGFSDPLTKFPYAPPDSVRVFAVNPETGETTQEKSRTDAANQPTTKRSPFVSDARKVAEYSKVVREFEEAGRFGVLGVYQDYLNELNKIPEDKRTIARAKQAFKIQQINDSVTDALNKEFDRRNAPRDLPPVNRVKEDRLQAGRPPWAYGRLRGKMFSGAREFLSKVMQVISGIAGR